MGLFKRRDSPFWWMLLEGQGRKKESTGIKHQARSPKVQAALRAQAEQIYHARMVQIARGKVGLPIDTGITFRPWSTWYEEHHTVRHRGALRERVILEHLRGFFGTMTLQEIRPARWQEYHSARLKAGVGVNTVGRELAVMKAILTAAVGEHLEVNPLANVKRVSVKVKAKRTITAAEEKRLLWELSDAGADARNGGERDRTPAARTRELRARAELHDLYLVGVGTLLRQMNLVQLRAGDRRGDHLAIDTKTGPHTVSLAGPTHLQRRAALVLKRRTPSTPNGYFFPEWQARFAKDPTGANSKFLQAFRRACLRAEIPWGLEANGVVWHTATRASGATRMLRDYGVDIRTVQLIGGWRSLDQMAAYLGVDLSPSATAAPARKRRTA